MSGVDAVGTGHPDGEVRAMPHGAMLLTGSALAVAAGGTNIPGISGFLEIAAYRSLVVQVKNSGANDVTITPRWNFFDGVSAINAEDVQTVPAGTSKRLLFQNLGDIVNRIRAAAPAGGSTIDYYVTGSNLDPFRAGAREILYMVQRTPAQSIPDMVSTLIEFGPQAGTRFYTNAAADWSFDVTGAGDYNGVHILAPGLYLVHARLSFAAPGNYNKTLALVCNSAETNPIGNANEQDQTFDTFAPTLMASSLFALSPGSAVVGSNSITVAGAQVSGGAVNVDQATLWIARLGSVFP